MKIITGQKGYTFIELLAVIMIMITVGTVIASILVSTLRSGNKNNSLSDIRQNGNSAILQMSKMIEYAKSFDGVSTDGLDFTSCITPTPIPLSPTPTPVPYYFVKITSFDNNQTTFGCYNQILASISSTLGEVRLVSANTNANCYFFCTQDSYSTSPTIQFILTLSTRNRGPLPENNASMSFNTSVTVRNY
jgi:type II secretory pathway pseudopilin PulG